MDLKKFSRTLSRVLPCAGLLGVFMVATGCETEPNGFLDPGQPARLRGEPLIVPIATKLNIGTTDEESLEFGSARDVQPGDLVATASDYTISANDLLSVSINDLVAPGAVTQLTIRVTQTGKISLQLLPNPIVAEGLTEQQLERAIADAYRDEQTVKNASPSVSVIEARGRTFSVLGAAGASGLYSIYDKNFRLLDAMVAARGESAPDSGNDTVYIIRRKEAGAAPVVPAGNNNGVKPGVDPLAPQSNATILPRKSQMLSQDGMAPEGSTVIVDGKEVPVNQPTAATQPGAVETQPPAPSPAEFTFNSLSEPSDREIIRVPYDKLKKGELKYNVVIKPGDLIFAPGPRTGVYYMGGQVASPGAYSLSGTQITLSQAIVSARGFSETAVPWRTEIVRRLPGDKNVFVMVNLSKIFAGEEPDIYLKPDDRINVGTTWWAPFLASVRNGFRFTYGFGFLYDKNFNEDDNNN